MGKPKFAFTPDDKDDYLGMEDEPIGAKAFTFNGIISNYGHVLYQSVSFDGIDDSVSWDTPVVWHLEEILGSILILDDCRKTIPLKGGIKNKYHNL